MHILHSCRSNSCWFCGPQVLPPNFGHSFLRCYSHSFLWHQLSSALSSCWAGTGGTMPKTDPRNLMQEMRDPFDLARELKQVWEWCRISLDQHTPLMDQINFLRFFSFGISSSYCLIKFIIMWSWMSVRRWYSLCYSLLSLRVYSKDTQCINALFE